MEGGEAEVAAAVEVGVPALVHQAQAHKVQVLLAAVVVALRT